MNRDSDLTYLKDLTVNPYIQIPFPVTKESIAASMNSFFKFLELPDEIKEQIKIKISPKHRRGDIGFYHRDPSVDLYNDSKDFFHFHPLVMEKFSELISVHPLLSDFLNNANAIWDICYNIFYQILSSFETEYPGTLEKIFNTKEPHILLRFLKYNWVNSGQYLAKPHFDAGSFTLAIAESCNGLRIGTGPDDLKIVDHEDGKAIFMVSSNFQKIIDTNLLKAAWHDVIQLNENQIGKPFARWALVAFVDGYDVEALPRNETHKWFKVESY